jgi:hypothetical protein
MDLGLIRTISEHIRLLHRRPFVRTADRSNWSWYPASVLDTKWRPIKLSDGSEFMPSWLSVSGVGIALTVNRWFKRLLKPTISPSYSPCTMARTYGWLPRGEGRQEYAFPYATQMRYSIRHFSRLYNATIVIYSG